MDEVIQFIVGFVLLLCAVLIIFDLTKKPLKFEDCGNLSSPAELNTMDCKGGQ